MDFDQETKDDEMYYFSSVGIVIYSAIVFIISYVYVIKKDYNEHYQYYFDVKEYDDCFINNISYTNYSVTNETEINLYGYIPKINFTDYITDNIDNITEYTYFYKSNNDTYLSEVINKTFNESLFQNITCYSDNKRIYINNNHDYKYQDLFVYEFCLVYFSLSLCICSMTCILINNFRENNTDNANNNNHNEINIVYVNNNEYNENDDEYIV